MMSEDGEPGEAAVRETLRDFMIAVAASGALFAGFQSWNNGRQIAELRGELSATAATVNAHVNAAGLHP